MRQPMLCGIVISFAANIHWGSRVCMIMGQLKLNHHKIWQVSMPPRAINAWIILVTISNWDDTDVIYRIFIIFASLIKSWPSSHNFFQHSKSWAIGPISQCMWVSSIRTLYTKRFLHQMDILFRFFNYRGIGFHRTPPTIWYWTSVFMAQWRS